MEMKGKWLWLGSSNEKNFRKEFENEDRTFELCTKFSHFKAKIDAIEDGYQFMTITGIDNIVADLGGKLDQLKLKTEEFFQSLEELRVKGMQIIVGPLLPWKKHSPELKRTAVDVLKDLKTKFPGIKQIARPPSLSFTKDNVHLTERAAKIHYRTVYKASYETFYCKEDDYLTEDEGAKPMDITTDQELEFSTRKKRKTREDDETSSEETTDPQDAEGPSKHSIHTPEFQFIMNKLENLRQQITSRWNVDLLVSAGTKEDLDKIENNLNMNKVVVMGLDIPDLWESDDWKMRIAHIKDSVSDLFKFINPGSNYNIGFVRHLNAKLKAARQIVEVTLDSEKIGRSIRKAYSARIKEWREKKLFPDRMNGVSITPSLTLATRVRIAILKAIAKMMPEEFEDTEAWVIQHVARPVLKVEQKEKDGRKILTSYGFAQAVA